MKLKICGMKISSRSRKRRAAHFRKSKYAFDKSLFTFSAVHLFLRFPLTILQISEMSAPFQVFETRLVSRNCFLPERLRIVFA